MCVIISAEERPVYKFYILPVRGRYPPPPPPPPLLRVCSELSSQVLLMTMLMVLAYTYISCCCCLGPLEPNKMKRFK